MTYECALDMLNLDIDKSNIGNINRVALFTALQALEKQIHKKVRPQQDKPIGFPLYTCPSCAAAFERYGQNYCSKCGQALDWK